MEWKSKCRACLTKESEMHCLYNELDEGLTLADILKQNIQYEVDKDDDMSTFLCISCTKILVDFHNFRIIFLDNEEQIKKLLPTKEAAQEVLDDVTEKLNDLENHSKNSNEIIQHCNNSQAKNTNNAEEITIKEEEVRNNAARMIIEGAKVDPQLLLSLQGGSNVVQGLRETNTVLKRKRRYVKMRPIHEGIRCQFCREYFPDKPTLREHTNIHKTHVCDVCGAAFTRKTYLMDHQEVHDGECKHICNFCGKAFRRRTVLVKHRRIHTHPRECVCEVCGKRFNDKGTLKTHIMLKHTKERKFVCSICNATFPLKATLDKHVKRHEDTNEKEFVCDICNTAYKDKSSLRRHVQIKHVEGAQKKEICLCAKAYSSKEALMKHKKKCPSFKAMMGEAFVEDEESKPYMEQFEVIMC